MNISRTKARSPALPPLPKISPTGKGTLVTEPIEYFAPETTKTRLGSIPGGYRTSTGGRRASRDHLFKDGNKEASVNGRSRDVWYKQPKLDSTGRPIMKKVSEPLTIKYKDPMASGIEMGLIGAGIGAAICFAAGASSGLQPLQVLGASLAGGLLGGLVIGDAARSEAADERVRLEWQKVDVEERELRGYSHDVTAHSECAIIDDDPYCTPDYEHKFRPIFAREKHGEYYRPVVVRYQ